MDEFKVSEYAVSQAKSLIKEKGILGLPQSRKDKLLNEDVITSVKNF